MSKIDNLGVRRCKFEKRHFADDFVIRRGLIELQANDEVDSLSYCPVTPTGNRGWPDICGGS